MINIVIILVLIAVYIFFTKDNTKIIEGLNTFNGRMAIDDQYFYDKLFDDVVYYPNEYDQDYKTREEIGKLVSTGWIRCKEECTGHCVEFGLSGASYCFPS
jgi:hypothetical protein